MIWYYAENNAQAGPVSDEQLRELAQAGRIQGATLVWKAGMDAWTPLAQAVPGLAPSLPAAAVAKPSVSSDTAVTQRPFGQLMPETALCESCKQFKPLDELVQISGQRVCAQCKPLELQKLQQGETTHELNYAGFWIRFAGLMMDGIVLSPVVLILYFFLIPRVLTAAPGADALGTQAVLQLIFFALSGAYKTFFGGRYSATPGQMIAGLRTVREDGSPISYGIAALRFLAEIISGLILYIGYLMLVFDKQKRTLHDRLCNTRVIRK